MTPFSTSHRNNVVQDLGLGWILVPFLSEGSPGLVHLVPLLVDDPVKTFENFTVHPPYALVGTMYPVFYQDF